ncbi:MAG: helix-turn-helix domain-containing protein [Burkholderiales bacterium]|jgi:transcriptional regulator GlxA family with amidase domain|nr:helix-turn-helix domain-containing protein [Burkholderiales bacterium]
MTAPIRVLFVMLPNSLALDWAGPAEALRTANQVLLGLKQPPSFQLEFIGPVSDPISSVGLGLRDVKPLPDLSVMDGAPPVWVVLLGQPGTTIDIRSAHSRATLHWLRRLRLQPSRLELVCICAGSVLAAHAGLLAGAEATTHHHHLAELQAAAPDCHVLSNRVFISSGAICSSAGVTTGIDLMLHRIAGVCGPVVAAKVAESMVVALRRGPSDPELSPFLSHRGHLHPALHRVQDAICQQPQAAWSVADMARVACTSPRHLSRIFAEQAGIAPLQYLRRIRITTAEAALKAGVSVGRAAELAGFSSDTQLRRAWRQLGPQGLSPSASRG